MFGMATFLMNGKAIGGSYQSFQTSPRRETESGMDEGQSQVMTSKMHNDCDFLFIFYHRTMPWVSTLHVYMHTVWVLYIYV